QPAFRRYLLPLTASANALRNVGSGRIVNSLPQHIPAEETVVRSFPRQRVGIACENLISDGGQAFAENLADIRMSSGSLHDLADTVLIDVSDRELIEVGGKAATGFDLASRVYDQCLARTLAVVFLEPGAVPPSCQSLGPLHGSEMIPVERDGQTRRDHEPP